MGVDIAVVVSNRWRAWNLLPGWNSNGRDIGWAEAIGFELLVQVILASSQPGQYFRVFGDNKGVVEGWWKKKGRSRNRQTKTLYSGESTTSLLLANALILCATSQAKTIRQMPLPEESTCLLLSSLLSQSQMPSGTSSKTLTVSSLFSNRSLEPTTSALDPDKLHHKATSNLSSWWTTLDPL